MPIGSLWCKAQAISLIVAILFSDIIPSATIDPCTGNLRILKPAPYEPVYPDEFRVLFSLRASSESGLVCIKIDSKHVGTVQVPGLNPEDVNDAQFEWHPNQGQKNDLYGFSLLTLDYSTSSTCELACCGGNSATCSRCARASCTIEFEFVRFKTRQFSGACRALPGPPQPHAVPNSSHPTSPHEGDLVQLERDAALGKAGAPASLLRRYAPRRFLAPPPEGINPIRTGIAYIHALSLVARALESFHPTFPPALFFPSRRRPCPFPIK
jgi:hypothetical protein